MNIDWMLLSFRLNMEERLGSLILATDISRQNNYLSEFRAHLDKRDLCLTNGGHRHFILQVSNVYQITKRALMTDCIIHHPFPLLWH